MDENKQTLIIVLAIIFAVLIATSVAVIVTGNPTHFQWLGILIILPFVLS